MTPYPFTEATFEPLGATSFSESVLEARQGTGLTTNHPLVADDMADSQVGGSLQNALEVSNFTDSQATCTDNHSSDSDTEPGTPSDEANKPHGPPNGTQPDNMGGHQYPVARILFSISIPKDSGVGSTVFNHDQGAAPPITPTPHDTDVTLSPIDGEMIPTPPPQLSTHPVSHPNQSCQSAQLTPHSERHETPGKAKSRERSPSNMPAHVVGRTEDLPEDLPAVSSGAPPNTPVHATDFASPRSDELFLDYMKSFKCSVCLQCVTMTVVGGKITMDGSLYSLSCGCVSIPL